MIEVVPPGVRTTLLGQEDNDHAMPLDDYPTETLDLLREKPDAKEIVVERARFDQVTRTKRRSTDPQALTIACDPPVQSTAFLSNHPGDGRAAEEDAERNDREPGGIGFHGREQDDGANGQRQEHQHAQ
ncbi:hypothetical protein [Streptomyces sp. NPDC017435]|uniref:hypothetical protein n=1 Tax=Streptomyces sp. NPDC017435 TaxID=3364995 RepID=UPI00378DACCE